MAHRDLISQQKIQILQRKYYHFSLLISPKLKKSSILCNISILNKLYLSILNQRGPMNFRQNSYPENYDDLTKNVVNNTAALKYSQLKNKKKGIPIDKEKLYEENYDLRNRVKQLEEINLKLRTQLTVAQKEKDDLFNMAEEEVFNQKIPQRSQSGAHKMSTGHPLQNKSNLTLLKEKQNSTFKKMIREKHSEIQKLKMQNTNIKKTMKFTRVNELITENNELIDETRRLKMQILEARSYNDQFNAEYSNRIENLKKQLQQERDGEKKNGMELKRQLEVVNELREKLREAELKKVEAEKRLNRQIKAIKAENLDLRSKIIVQAGGKDCDKADCVKIRKEKAQLKRKIEQLEKQVKNLNEELLADKKNALEKQFQYKRLLDANKKAESQNPTKQKANQQNHPGNHSPASTKKDQPSSVVKPIVKSQIKVELPIQQKSQIKQKSNSQIKKAVEPQPTKKQQVEKNEEKVALPAKIEEKDITKIQVKKPQELKKPQNNLNVESKLNKNEEKIQSDDTQQLLQSLEDKPDKKQAKSKKKQPPSKAEPLIKPKVDNEEERYKQSDGQYEQLNFEDQQTPKQPVKKEKTQKKQKSKVDKQGQNKKQKSKSHKKSTKKVQQMVESDEEILYSNEKKEEHDDGKQQLKAIRQTLTYKFMAQGYSYDQFANLVKQSGKKQFTVAQVMNVLSEEPFLLSEQNIQTMIIYLYETGNLTGQEVISSKNFMKKIKKFIGKAKAIDEELEGEKINKLISIIQSDEGGKKKIRSQCKKFDSGDGSIDRQNFIAIMQGMNVKNELLQTALAQIVYVSEDINHLNYDFFLKRLNDVQG